MNAAPAASPRFFWQGVLIVLPVAVLAVFALYSLRQDRVLVEHETREKAQVEADRITERLWAALDDPASRAALQVWKRSRGTPETLIQGKTAALNAAFLFQVDAAGQLLFPPPLPVLPEPRLLNLGDLNDEQTTLWLAAQGAALKAQTNFLKAAESLSQFVALAPPEQFLAAARYQLGVLLSRDGQPAAAVLEFQALAKSFPHSYAESGLPLPPFALLNAAEQSLLVTNAGVDCPAAMLEAACSNAVFVPSLVTMQLLKAALRLDAALGTNIAATWQAVWLDHQSARALHTAARPALTAVTADAARHRTRDKSRDIWFREPSGPAGLFPPRLFWFAMPMGFPGAPPEEERAWNYDKLLATRIDTDTNGGWFVCRSGFDRRFGSRSMSLPKHPAPGQPMIIGSNIVKTANDGPPLQHPDPLLAELEKQRAQLPEYFELSLELAGRVIISSNYLPAFAYSSGGNGSGRYWKKSDTATSPPLLASAFREEGGVEYLRVGIHLTNPELLYAPQHKRTRLFGLLIGASALAAVIGFASARHAFRHQQLLAEMKSNFVSSVSHELRAPIASVRLMAESLDRGKIAEPGKQREYFRFIVQECRRLGTLIENVLDFARIEQGRKQYGFEPTDLVALVRQTVQLMEPGATEREVTLRCNDATMQRCNDSTPPDQHLSGSAGVSPASGSEPRRQDASVPGRDPAHLQPSLDGAAIQQALVNLLDNAIKHSPPRTSVTVALESIPHPPSLLLSVQDHGPGIPADEHEKIFERFYRRGSELRRETQGVGIGLSIVKHVAEAHGGRVRVESEVGKGSRFIIELPLVPEILNPKS